MKAVVLYDSFFGNTEQIARSVAEVLRSRAEVDLVRVGDLHPQQLQGVDLLVVGSPTRAFRPTEPITVWLKSISIQGVKSAAFDTRIATADAHSALLSVMVKIFGYAAEPIAKALKKRGGVLVLPAEGFFVKASEGPLKDGELERAAAWAGQILAAC
jgi:flavodoxin I